jgi:DNA-binding protein HU-beta
MTTANEIADQLADEHQLTKGQARAFVEGAFKAVALAAAAGEEISLPGFGKCKVKISPERRGRNPATGATMTIAASRKLGFFPAKALRDALNG